MPWRNWSVIVVLILANYLVFSLLATVVFPVQAQVPATRIVVPTYTPGTPAPQRVGTLTYDFLTPSATPIPTDTPMPTPKATIVPTGAAKP